MHFKISPVAARLNSCSLLKGFLSSSALIPLKEHLTVSVTFILLFLCLICNQLLVHAYKAAGTHWLFPLKSTRQHQNGVYVNGKTVT